MMKLSGLLGVLGGGKAPELPVQRPTLEQARAALREAGEALPTTKEELQRWTAEYLAGHRDLLDVLDPRKWETGRAPGGLVDFDLVTRDPRRYRTVGLAFMAWREGFTHRAALDRAATLLLNHQVYAQSVPGYASVARDFNEALKAHVDIRQATEGRRARLDDGISSFWGWLDWADRAFVETRKRFENDDARDMALVNAAFGQTATLAAFFGDLSGASNEALLNTVLPMRGQVLLGDSPLTAGGRDGLADTFQTQASTMYSLLGSR